MFILSLCCLIVFHKFYHISHLVNNVLQKATSSCNVLKCVFFIFGPSSNLETALDHCSWWPKGAEWLHLWRSTNSMFILSLCCSAVLQQFYYTIFKMWPIQFYIFVSHQPLVLYQKAFLKLRFCSKCIKYCGGKTSPLLHFWWQMLSLIPKQIPCPVGHCNANVQIHLYLESAPSYY